MYLLPAWSVKVLYDIHNNLLQMSKSTGNFLTLRQAVERFSADGQLVNGTTMVAAIYMHALA